MLGREDTWDDALSDDSVTSVFDQDHVEDMKVIDFEADYLLEVSKISVDGCDGGSGFETFLLAVVEGGLLGDGVEDAVVDVDVLLLGVQWVQRSHLPVHEILGSLCCSSDEVGVDFDEEFGFVEFLHMR